MVFRWNGDRREEGEEVEEGAEGVQRVGAGKIFSSELEFIWYRFSVLQFLASRLCINDVGDN